MIFLTYSVSANLNGTLVKYHNILSVEKIIRELAQEKQIKIYGSFNPFKLGFDETYFYDGMHCNEKGVFEIFERLCQ